MIANRRAHSGRPDLGRLAGLLTALALMLPAMVAAQDKSEQDLSLQHLPSVWDLRLGDHARLMPTADFADYACGTNGGPPSRPLTGWTDFSKCQPEQGSGLREVYYEYDDEREYRGRARHMDLEVMRVEYTWVNGIPVIASALFDADGFYVGTRLVTDPRVGVAMRDKGMNLGGFLFVRYGEDGWSCINQPKKEGESAYKEVYLKQVCTMRTTLPEAGQVDLRVEIQNYRRAGQARLNRDNVPTQGEFESSTRFDAILVDPIPDGAARLAEIVKLGPPPLDPIVQKAMSCPGCDLHGANLKRADLHGAKLSGADLTGANLHAANLDGADLSGADLTGANLNRVTMRGANLHGANLQQAMLFRSQLDGSDLSSATLSGALAGEVRLTRANLSGAMLWAADLRDARLNAVNFTGANLNGAWLHNAELSRADFSNAILLYVLAHDANLQGAKLTGVDARGADFYGSNFRDSDLTAADFSYTILTGVNLYQSTLAGAKFEESELPAGFTPPG